ncbi:MAG TPA: hypothetical protein VGI72_05040, partial [Gaiellales bacterium]
APSNPARTPPTNPDRAAGVLRTTMTALDVTRALDRRAADPPSAHRRLERATPRRPDAEALRSGI